MIDWHAISLFFLAPSHINIDFNDIGIALLSIGLIFPILDKLTGKSIEDFKDLKKILKDNKNLGRQDADNLISQINDTIERLTKKTVLRTFRNIILLAFIFLILSAVYNTYQITYIFFLLVTYLLVLSIYLFLIIGKRIRERTAHIELIKKFHNILGNPVAALNEALKTHKDYSAH